jgi:hypothetical protein
MSRRRTSLNSYRRAYGCCVVTTKYGDVPNNEPPAVPTIVTDGLIIRYEAGDTNSYSGSGSNIWRNIGSGGSAYDASTNITPSNNHLPTFSDASFNFGYARINATNNIPPNEYLTNPNLKYFSINRSGILSNDFTYCAWIKTTNVGQGTDHFTLMYIVSTEVPDQFQDYGFGIDSNGKLAYGDGATSDITISSINIVNTNSWKFVCVTRQQSSGRVSLYIDGSLDSTGTCGSGDPVGNLFRSNYILIGAQADKAGYTFGGSIRAIFGYSRVLTASEILNNFNVQRSSYGV